MPGRAGMTMRILISTHDASDPYFLVQLGSMVRHGVPPEALVLHHSGARYALGHRLRGLWRVLRQYRSAAIAHLRARTRVQDGTASPGEHADLAELGRTHLGTLPVRRTGGINGGAARRLLADMGPVLVVSNSGLLGRRVLALPNALFLNVHVSKLPRFRGMNNVEWALFHGERLWATVHRIAPGIDTGDILLQEALPAPHVPLADIRAVRAYAFAQGHARVGKAVAGLLAGEAKWVPQPAPASALDQYYVMHPLLRDVVQRRLEAHGGTLPGSEVHGR